MPGGEPFMNKEILEWLQTLDLSDINLKVKSSTISDNLTVVGINMTPLKPGEIKLFSIGPALSKDTAKKLCESKGYKLATAAKIIEKKITGCSAGAGGWVSDRDKPGWYVHDGSGCGTKRSFVDGAYYGQPGVKYNAFCTRD